MKIYTKTGDQGKSSLFSGERVPKNHGRMTAYGDVDELNSLIGVLLAALPAAENQLHTQLKGLQATLFQVGAVLATSPDSARSGQLAPITTDHTRTLEGYIDAFQAELPELNSFVLPGGHVTAAWAHMARTVCRRTERSVVGLIEDLKVQGQPPHDSLTQILVFLNRLSDYFFIVARQCNAIYGTGDVPWQG